MGKKSEISVCIPTYNQADYLEKAIRSAHRQSLTPMEIIVSDDCSTDATPRVLERLRKEISILKVIRQPQNLGLTKNTDACLRLAKGDFVIKLDSDDYLAPLYAEKLCGLLQEYPNAGYAHGAVQEIDEKGQPTRLRTLARKKVYQNSEEALKAAKSGYRVAANIILFRLKALRKLDFMVGRPKHAEDYHLSADLAANGFGNVYCNEVLAYYRVWYDSEGVRQKRKIKEINGLYEVFENVLKPAYQNKNWNTKELDQKRMLFACAQADCLSWDIYNKEEKDELQRALLKLSPSHIAKTVTNLYKNGNGWMIDSYWSLKTIVARGAKAVLYPTKVK